MLALGAESRDDWRRAQNYWDGVVGALARQQTPDAPLARAVVLRHLADLAQRHPEMHGGPWTDPVTDYLERSLEADPDHLPATLALIERYRTADSPRDWHRATDLAAKRFPGNTAILLQAVDAAVARSAYKKAVGLARRVLTLDPINQPVRQRMIELQLAYARKQMRSARADLAGKALSQAAEWERADAPSAPLRIGQALVAMHADQNPEAEGRLHEAVHLAGGGTAGWFRAVLEAASMGWPEQRRQSMHRELATAQAGEPSREAILSLVGMLGQKDIQDNKRVIASVLWRIEPSLTGGSRIAWSTAEFQTIAASLHRLAAFDALLAYAREAMRRDEADPPARFYRIVAQVKGDRFRLTDAQETELYDLMDQAGNRQDYLSAPPDFSVTPQPWQRTGPGNASDGKLKFDLTKFNQAYFDRLRDRVQQLNAAGIYAGVYLFTGEWLLRFRFSGDGYPFTGSNNVNGIDDGGGTGSVTMTAPNAITAIQDAYVKKVIDTLNDLPNVLWIVSEEAPADSKWWNSHLIALTRSYEAGKPLQHPIGYGVLDGHQG